MHAKSVLIGLLGITALTEATAISRPFDQIFARRNAQALASRQFGKGQNQNQGNNAKANTGNSNANAGNNNANTGTNTGNNNAAASLTLNTNALQTGSQSDGDPDASEGESASATDNANFINFCSGKTLTNGLQQKQGSCNGIPMGEIPATTNMVSSVLINPQHNDNLQANQDFDIQVQVDNFQPGTFTNANNTYYSAPQQLNSQGQIIGHTHVTVQDMGNSLNPTQPLDATQFVFFKGINDAGNGKGLLAATVTGGLPAGNYRVCTMFSSANHQPVLMPVAQRGAQDDCNKFTVGGSGNNASAQSGSSSSANSGTSATTSATASATAKAGNNASAGNNANGQKGGKGQKAGQSNNSQTSAATGGNANSATTQTNNLGGAAPSVTNSGDASRPFAVNGNTFVTQAAAKQRSCDIQNNACSDAANAGASFTLADCQAQLATCQAS
ncbi:hypothetical protein GGR53DRAFT_528758 [Hypoxylon sp. FL1150]|nr:hypothetical protein GGR53DRAFT_528758 [Hypoxylon sp. FL1150]